jgi:hypothetical protein
VLLAVGCGSSSARQTQPSLATVKKAFVAKLNQEALTYHSVACVRNGRSYKGLPIVRCNVNFGMDPHVEAYCTVFENGKLVTNHDNKAIPCEHDNAGFTVPTAEGS